MASPPTSLKSPPLASTRAEKRAKGAIAEWLRSPEVRAKFKVGPPIGRWVVAGVFVVTFVGIPVGLGIFIGSLIVWSRRKRAYAEFLERMDRAQRLWVYPLMVNSSLLQRPGVRAPGLVMGTFAPGVDHEYFAHLAGVIGLLSSGPADTEEAKFVDGLFRDERFTEGRRRMLPPSLTGGVPVYAFDLMIDSSHLPENTVPGPLIPCIAEPGETGIIMTVPFAFVGTASDWLILLEEKPSEVDGRRL